MESEPVATGVSNPLRLVLFLFLALALALALALTVSSIFDDIAHALYEWQVVVSHLNFDPKPQQKEMDYTIFCGLPDGKPAFPVNILGINRGKSYRLLCIRIRNAYLCPSAPLRTD